MDGLKKNGLHMQTVLLFNAHKRPPGRATGALFSIINNQGKKVLFSGPHQAADYMAEIGSLF